MLTLFSFCFVETAGKFKPVLIYYTFTNYSLYKNNLFYSVNVKYFPSSRYTFLYFIQHIYLLIICFSLLSCQPAILISVILSNVLTMLQSNDHFCAGKVYLGKSLTILEALYKMCLCFCNTCKIFQTIFYI